MPKLIKSLPEKLSLSTILLTGAGLALLAVTGIAASIYLLPALGLAEGSYTRLDAANPTILHPDGLLVTFQAGGEPVAVRLDSQPREPFIAGQAGSAWADAFLQLPPELTPVSPIYTIEAREAPAGRLYAEMNIPNGAEPLETLSLYAWDEQAGAWVFMPSRQDIVRDVIGFTPASSVTHVAAMQLAARRPGVALVIGEGTTLDAAVSQALEVVLPTGAVLLSDGTLSGQPAPITQTGEALVTPLVSNADQEAGVGFHPSNDSALNEAAVGSLSALAADYPGLALDFEVMPDEREAFGPFVEALAARLHAEGKTLSLVVRGTTLDAYDLSRLGRSADQIWWAPGDDPTMYLEGGPVQNLLYALVGDLDRRRLGLLVSSDSVDVSPSAVTALTTEEALDVFGQVAPIEGYISAEGKATAGEQIPFRLTGSLQAMSYDAALGANYVAYTGEDGLTHHVYLSSAESLTRKLNWAVRYGLNAVAVENNNDALAVNAATSGLAAFIAQTPAAAPPALTIAWQVTGQGGTTLSETAGDLSAIQYLWVAADDPGDYVISAAVGGQAASQRGEVHVTVVKPTPTPQPLPQPAAEQPAPATSTESSEGTAQPAPAVAAGAAAGGGFELGGQVNGSQFYDFMHQAGMTWVKYQFRNLGDLGGAAATINGAHAAGFKVLLTMLGGHGANLDAWAQFMGQVAALGPDAIEVWNEPNFDIEWPAEPGGENYVNLLLAPAYNAIKSANPNVMVISGAPTPTGAFGGCGSVTTARGPQAGCDDNVWLQGVVAAGGANFMDCVGVHYNAGATSAYATSGHPTGSGHYSWYLPAMINQYSIVGRPLCFTELGYVTGPVGGDFWWGDGTTVEQQAQWLAEAATLSSQRGVRLMIVWNVGGFGGGGGDPQSRYAIVRGGSCPACETLGRVMGVQ